MPKRILRPLLGAVLLLSAACSTLNTTGESVAQVAYTGAPQIQIISPQANARYREGADVYVVARVDNAGPNIGSMTVRIGDDVIAQATKPDTGGGSSFSIKAKWPATRSGNQTISVSVQRGDPSLSDLKTVDIEVLGAPTPTVAPTVAATATTEAPVQPTTDPSTNPVNVQPTTDPGQPAVPTATTEPPTAAPSPTPSAPQVTVKSGANVRKGPSTAFEPPLGSMAAGQTAEIVAKNADASWYKIKYYNGEGWIAAFTVDIQGNVNSLPVDAGPPTPIPQPTAIPATAAPTVPSNVPDLVVDGVPSISPHPFTCGQSSTIVVKVKNAGTAASAGMEILIQDIFNGQPGASTKTVVGAIQPGQTISAPEAYLTVSTNYGQLHTIRVTVDNNANNTESNESNNVFSGADYTLLQGSCP